MEEIGNEQYLNYLIRKRSITVEGVEIPIGKPHSIRSWAPPAAYQPETRTLWSFESRGTWATHDGQYRGNWSPYVPRNLIERYTRPRDWVCDPMMGSGTTLVESKLLGRNAIGMDINPDAVILTLDRLHFRAPWDPSFAIATVKTYVGDARRLDKIPNEVVDLVATHPPYGDIIRYGSGIEGDLSRFTSFADYIQGI